VLSVARITISAVATDEGILMRLLSLAAMTAGIAGAANQRIR
jgi:hypothetical protein